MLLLLLIIRVMLGKSVLIFFLINDKVLEKKSNCVRNAFPDIRN